MAIKFLNSVNADSGVLYVDAVNNRVGIGTTSPGFKLDVNGTVKAGSYLVTPLIYSGGGNIVFGNVAQFNDWVGIGTTSPSDKLHVVGNVRWGTDAFQGTLGYGTGVVAVSTSGTSTGTVLQLNAENRGIHITPSNNIKFVGYTAGLLTSDASGNVSVDTNTYLTAEADTLDSVTDRGATTANSIAVGGVTSQNFTAGVQGFSIEPGDSTVTTYRFDADRFRLYSGNFGEIFSLKENGNLGLGITDPGQKLSINGSVQAYNAIYLGANQTSGASLLRFNNYDATLVDQDDVQNIIQMNGRYWSGSNNQIVKTEIRSIKDSSDGNGGSALGFATQTGGNAPVEHMRINKSGNVGIGTTSPSSTLTVNGAIEILKDDISSTSEGGHLTFRAGSAYSYRYSVDNFADKFRIFRENDSDGTNGLVFMQFDTSGNLRLNQYGAGVLTTDASGNVTASTAYQTQATADGRYLNTSGDTATGILQLNPSAQGAGLKFSQVSDAGSHYQPTEAGVATDRYWLRFDHTNNASYPYLTNRTPSGAVVIKTGTAAGGSENEHFRIKGGDGVVDAYFTNANVGIGTTSPAEDLHIGNNNPVIQIGTINITTGNSKIQFFSGNNGTFNGYAIQYTKDTGVDRLDFIDGGGTAKVSFQNGGNVGIGTTSPNRNLSVVGQLSIDNSEVASSTAGMLFSADTASNKIYSRIANNNSTALPFEIISGASSSLYISTGGNVGIGTSSPSEKLEVNGVARIRRAGNGAEYLNISVVDTLTTFTHTEDTTDAGNGHGGFKFLSNGAATGTNELFQIANAGGDVLLINSSGNLQLPSYGAGYLKSDASGNITVDADIIEDTLDSVTDRGSTTTNNISVADLYATGGIINLGTANVSSGHINAYENMTFNIDSDNDDTSRYFGWYTNGITGAGTHLMRLTESGNLLIGSTSSNAQVHIVKSGSNATYGRGKSGNLDLENSNTAVTQGGWLSISGYMGNTVSQYQMGMITGGKDSAAADGNYAGHLSFWTTSGGANGESNSGGYERMRINGAGNVGIGTTTPENKLHVYGGRIVIDNVAAAQSAIQFNSAGAEKSVIYRPGGSNDLQFYKSGSGDVLRITDSGLVGIGTTSPSAKLHVYGSGTTYATIQAGGGDYAYVRLQTPSSGNGYLIKNTGTGNSVLNKSLYLWNDVGPIQFVTNQTAGNAVTIDTSGNLGIGTSNPTAPLHVIGTVRMGDTSDGLTFTSGSGIGNIIGVDTGFAGYNAVAIKASANTGIYLDTADNVGIGTTSPSDKLHVVGNARFGGGSSDQHIKILHGNGGSDYGAIRFYENGVNNQTIHAFSTGWQSGNPLVSGGSVNITGVYAVTLGDWNDPDAVIRNGGSTYFKNNVGIGNSSPSAKLDVTGSVRAGGKTTYTKVYGSLDTIGNAVAGLIAGSNGNSAMFTFTMYGGGEYQKIVYSCWNTSGTAWKVKKVIDEGTNALDITVDAEAATRNFTFVSRSGTVLYSPTVVIEHIGYSLDTSYLA